MGTGHAQPVCGRIDSTELNVPTTPSSRRYITGNHLLRFSSTKQESRRQVGKVENYISIKYRFVMSTDIQKGEALIWISISHQESHKIG